MDAESTSPQYSPPSLRHKLRTTVCGCFGSPSSDGERLSPQSGGRTRWRRKVAATGEFRYDPLSYALNFDEGAGSDDSDEGADAAAAFRYRNFNSRLPPSPVPAARRLTAVAIA
uniref:Uncharacterized protein n=1 Tax=Avena sativa TaxID=4498 RepID=A0ACD5UJX8_AVESA